MTDWQAQFEHLERRCPLTLTSDDLSVPSKPFWEQLYQAFKQRLSEEMGLAEGVKK